MDFFSDVVCFKIKQKPFFWSFPLVSSFLGSHTLGSLDKCAFQNVSQLPSGQLGECQQISSIPNMSDGIQLFHTISKIIVTGEMGQLCIRPLVGKFSRHTKRELLSSSSWENKPKWKHPAKVVNYLLGILASSENTVISFGTVGCHVAHLLSGYGK